MKKLIYLSFVLISLSAISCTQVRSQSASADAIDLGTLYIHKSGVSTNLPVDAVPADFATTFGSPSVSNTFTSQMDGETYLEYGYTGGRFFFYDGSLLYLDITSTNFDFILNSTTVSIGDNISSLSSSYPTSYSNREEGVIRFTTKVGSNYYDQTAAIFYDESTNLITRLVLEQ